MMAGFRDTPRNYERIAERKDLPDFKLSRALKLSGGADLVEVPTGSGVEYSTLTEGQETWNLRHFNRGIKFDWRCLIDDDMGALTGMPAKFGRAAARTRSNTFFNMFLTPGNMADGVAVWNAAHGNLVAAGAAPSAAQFGAMEALFDAQTDIDGTTPIDVGMQYVLYGPTHKLIIGQILRTDVVPEAIADRLTDAQLGMVPVFERRITGTQYWGLAQVGENGCVWGSLQGQPNPVVSSQTDFDTSGIAIKIEDTFGSAILEERGSVRNPGA